MKKLNINELFQNETIVDADISNELSDSILQYAVEVIIDRSLPQVEDGMKPVQRRILWTCWLRKFLSNGPFIKCARIVGDTMAFHAHGQMDIY